MFNYPNDLINCNSYEKVSVCMATYNGIDYVEEQIKSILPQLRDCDELIVVDDMSIDGTYEFLIALATKYQLIKVFRNSKNRGVVYSFERALNKADGHYIFLCDQDDYWLNNRVKTQVKSLTKHDLSLSNAWIVDRNLVKTGVKLFDVVIPRNSLLNFINNRVVGCSLAITRNAITKILPFNNVPMHDWYISVMASLLGMSTDIITEPLFLYRRHDSNVSVTVGKSNFPLVTKIFFRVKFIGCVFQYLYRHILLKIQKIFQGSDR